VTLPTAEEIRAAHDGITRDGPQADTTVGLCALVLREPELRGFVDRLTGEFPVLGRLNSAALLSCVTWGMNMGLRIGEQRADAQAAERRTADPNRPLAEDAKEWGEEFEATGRTEP
jgi:hypothetical protein